MSSQLSAIVVAPDSGTILEADVGGVAVWSYLSNRLTELGQGDVRILTDVEGVAAGYFQDRPTLSIPLTPSVERSLAGRDVLLVDARAWLPKQLLARMVSRAPKARQPQRLVVHRFDAIEPIEISLAVAFASGEFHAGLIQRARTVTGKGLEHVLTAEAIASAVPVGAAELHPSEPALLIDSYAELSKVEAQVLLDRAYAAMRKGVRIRDPHQVLLRGELDSGSDVEIETNVIIEGVVVLGDGVRIGANSILRECRIGANTRINPFSLVERSVVGPNGTVGPYARIRPGSSIGESVQIGNYVEIKNSEIGARSRINHHAFIGDAVLAEDVTIGAGTITCNHDGVRINRTIVERGAYIGSGCNLVAPIRVGPGATIGAGSTITEDVPAAKLTLARARQTTIETWEGPKRD
jgi:UDP-3-O-[3-hydroxymyristoyl] glucosamine N-acyltransferase